MTIYIQASQIEIAYIIAAELEKKGYTCLCFTTFSDTYSCIKNTITPPDLIAADFTFINHDYFNINKALLEDRIFTPVIFYNDPCLTRSKRSLHWYNFLEDRILHCKNTYNTSSFYDSKLDDYKLIFSILEELVEADYLRNYIPLMKEPDPLPDEIKYSRLELLKQNKANIIQDFQKRNNMPRNLCRLLEILYKNKNTDLSVQDLCKLYEKEAKTISPNSIKILLSQLRHFIKTDNQNNFSIESRDSKYIFKLRT